MDGWHYGSAPDFATSDATDGRLTFTCTHGNEITITGLGSWTSIKATFRDGCPLHVEPLKRKRPPKRGVAIG